jgi:cytoskeletal protein CcmA (bactofilin family)
MAIFSGKEGPSAEAVTLVGEEAYFHGALSAKGSLRIEGVVEGDITDAVSVEIGKKGRVKGNVAAETLSIAGVVEGDVVASRAIEVLAKGRLVGNIKTPRLRIDDGGYFDGSCSMTPADESESSSSASSYQSAPNN